MYVGDHSFPGCDYGVCLCLTDWSLADEWHYCGWAALAVQSQEEAAQDLLVAVLLPVELLHSVSDLTKLRSSLKGVGTDGL